MRDDDGNPCETESPSCRLRFGDTDEACTDKPFEFSHVYSCDASLIASLPECSGSRPPCIIDTPGEISCMFQPKVQVLDNWNWCNGIMDFASNYSYKGWYNGDYGIDPNAPGDCEPEAGPNPYEYGDFIIISR